MVDAELKKYILDNFRYDNGKITRIDRKNSNGSVDHYGYLILKVKGRQVKAHRIAWLLNYGDFPESELDHINRNKLDNRIENLRESNRTQQCRNRDVKPNKDTGEIGIYEDKCTPGLKKKYCFHVKGKTYRAYTIEEAKELRNYVRKITEDTKPTKMCENTAQ